MIELVREWKRVCVTVVVFALFACSAARRLPMNAEHAQPLPAVWLDLAESPVVVIRLGQLAMLENRTDIEIWRWTVGCVREVDGLVAVVGALWDVTTSGKWVKGYPRWDDLRSVNRLYADPDRSALNPVSIRPCQPGDRVAVTAVQSREGYSWTAQGQRWPREWANLGLQPSTAGASIHSDAAEAGR
jgi:hypothetical protein